MAKITLSIRDDDQKAIELLDGKRVFASAGCEEHNAYVIITTVEGEELDVQCILRSLHILARNITREAQEQN